MKEDLLLSSSPDLYLLTILLLLKYYLGFSLVSFGTFLVYHTLRT